MIKKGDNVIVIAGKDKGKKSTVVKVLPKESRLVVEGVNMHKKHQRASRGAKGQMIDIAGTIHISNVMVVDGKSGKGTRLGKKKIGDKVVRIAKKSGQEI